MLRTAWCTSEVDVSSPKPTSAGIRVSVRSTGMGATSQCSCKHHTPSLLCYHRPSLPSLWSATPLPPSRRKLRCCFGLVCLTPLPPLNPNHPCRKPLRPSTSPCQEVVTEDVYSIMHVLTHSGKFPFPSPPLPWSPLLVPSEPRPSPPCPAPTLL